jgi:hypothetical protein
VQLADQYQALKLLLQDEDNIQSTVEFDDVANDEDIEKDLSNIPESITEAFNSMPPLLETGYVCTYVCTYVYPDG